MLILMADAENTHNPESYAVGRVFTNVALPTILLAVFANYFLHASPEQAVVGSAAASSAVEVIRLAAHGMRRRGIERAQNPTMLGRLARRLVHKPS